jgi:probable HAF family extracellular repeat protein
MTNVLKDLQSTLSTHLHDGTGPGDRSGLETKLPKTGSSSMGTPAYYGAGNDIITLGDKSNIVYAGEGINLITTGLGNDKISAGAGSDFINAGDGRNVIFAGDGNNRILSGKGNDLIFAGAGNDSIYSGAGNDSIFAGDGNNIVNAGTGDDTVTLGNGSDKLILEGGKGSVTVTGFDVKVDKLRLGESLIGRSLTYKTQGGNTLVMSGKDLLATLKGVTAGSPNLVDNGPLYRYVAKDLGSLGTNPNGAVNANSINDFGTIAGRYDTGEVFANSSVNATTGVVTPNAANAVRQGFIWENGKLTALTPTGLKQGSSEFGTSFGAAANGTTTKLLTPNVTTISNNGIILGTGDEIRQPIGKATDRALLWEKDGASYKLTINDFGGQESYYFDTVDGNLIAGRNILVNGFDTPIYTENGKTVALADLGGEGGTARGLNGKGQIVGFLDTDGKLNDTAVNTAVLWEKGSNGKYQLKNLGTFGAEQAALRDLNDMGSIIGTTTNGTGATVTSNPFLLRDGEFTALGSLGGKTGSVNGLNESNQVVGASQIAAGTNHASVWTSGVFADLNNLVTAPITYNGAAVTLTSATSINNFGDIVATGTYTYKDKAGKDATGTRSYVLNAA